MKTSKNIVDWERSIVLELNSEHEYACRIYRVNLRPIAIILFDSETHWGEFDDLTRTISISRKLVHNYPWHQVIGVFRHEMAHQLVAESRQYEVAAGRPHNDQFKEACKRLGVPDQFAKAGLDLQGSELDWRSEKRDEATEKILEKVRKLLALAGSSNEHEALLAMERVRELYAKYNLENTKTNSGNKFVHLVICNCKKQMQAWQLKTISILTEHFFVKVLTFRQYNAKTYERDFAIELIGSRENVLMAEYVYYFLQNHLDLLVKDVSKEKDKSFGRIEKSSYRLGALDGFAEKLKRSETENRISDTDNPKSGLTLIGRAVAKFNEDEQLDEYLSDIYPRLRSRKKTSQRVNDEAFRAGHQAGKGLTLNKPLTTQMGNLGKQLTQTKR